LAEAVEKMEEVQDELEKVRDSTVLYYTVYTSAHSAVSAMGM